MVHNEITRGHRRSDYLAECHISSEMCHYLRTCYRGDCEKVLDSSLAALSLEKRQNCSNFNVLGYVVKKDGNSCFG